MYLDLHVAVTLLQRLSLCPTNYEIVMELVISYKMIVAL